MESGSNGFIYELKSIRSKLIRILDVFASANRSSIPPEQWPFWMEKFNALASQYHSLQKDLSLALESAIVHPVKVDPTVNSDLIPTVLLRTKLDPAIEAACQGEEVPVAQVKEDMRRLERIMEAFAEAKEEFEAELKESAKTAKRQPADKTNALLESTIKLMFNGSL